MNQIDTGNLLLYIHTKRYKIKEIIQEAIDIREVKEKNIIKIKKRKRIK